jgi:hypothetical protein
MSSAKMRKNEKDEDGSAGTPTRKISFRGVIVLYTVRGPKRGRESIPDTPRIEIDFLSLSPPRMVLQGSYKATPAADAAALRFLSSVASGKSRRSANSR